MKYTVAFAIYEQVKHTFSDETLMVLGYEVLPNGIRYICSNSKMDYKYLYEGELTALKKENPIGFLELNVLQGKTKS